MGLWVRTGWHRWERAWRLPSYHPPLFLRISPAPETPAWRLSWPIGRDFGADGLSELLSALLQATSVLPGRMELHKVVGNRLERVEGIAPFSPQAVRAPGLWLQRVEEEPAQWLLTLHLARAVGRVLAAEKEKYLGGWWASLQALQEACRGEGGPPAGSA